VHPLLHLCLFTTERRNCHSLALFDIQINMSSPLFHVLIHSNSKQYITGGAYPLPIPFTTVVHSVRERRAVIISQTCFAIKDPIKPLHPFSLSFSCTHNLDGVKMWYNVRTPQFLCAHKARIQSCQSSWLMMPNPYMSVPMSIYLATNLAPLDALLALLAHVLYVCVQ